MRNINYLPATEKDIPAIKKILQENQLPYEDIDNHFSNFITAWDSNKLIGSIGIEIIDNYGLLRSLIIIGPYRKKGIGITLCNKIIHYALKKNVKELYLLTTTAEQFFLQLGFQNTNRNLVPEGLKKTREFMDLCPSTAVCMIKTIK